MIQDIGNKHFDNQYKDISPRAEDILIAFKGRNKKEDTILISNDNGILSLPKVGDFSVESSLLRFVFSIDETNFFLYSEGDFTQGLPLDSDVSTGRLSGASFSYEQIRILRRAMPVDVCFAGMTAYHLFTWYRNTRFCGHCGTPAVHDKKLRMMQCPSCGNMMFPMIAPAVIVGVRNGDSLLLSTYAGRGYKGRALLAGFCEIGETPEQTVSREVFEEVGLKVKNIEYFDSQPWGFDSNLLLGYFCDVDGSTDIDMDAEELATAAFFKRSDIEADPNLFSLTATMIETFRQSKDK